MIYNFKTPEILAAALKLDGKAHEHGLALQKAYENKIKAIADGRFEDAARFREREVEIIEKLKLLNSL